MVKLKRKNVSPDCSFVIGNTAGHSEIIAGIKMANETVVLYVTCL